MKNQPTLVNPGTMLLIYRIFHKCKFVLTVFALVIALLSWTGCKSFNSTDDSVLEGELNSTDKVHLAFAGGGWRAHTGHSAWTLSLLDGGNKSLDDVFKNVGSVSSNSGGSWFSTMLMYSDDFVNAIEAPNAINSWDTTGWLGQQRIFFSNTNCKDETGAEFLLCICLNNAVDCAKWYDVVQDIVFKDYTIPTSVTLDGQHLQWAKNKPLLLASTLLTNQVILTDSVIRLDLGPSILYQACFDPSNPNLMGKMGAFCSGVDSTDVTPVTFSSIPGGSSYQAPPFLSQQESSGNAIFNVGYKQNAYPGKTFLGDTIVKSSLADTTAHITIQNPIVNDQVAVVQGAAASSAAGGFAASEGVTQSWDLSYVGEDAAVSFKLKDANVQYVDASDYTLQQLKDSIVVRLADGGVVDNSGVAQLVSFLQQNNGTTDTFNIVAFDNVSSAYTPTTGLKTPVGPDIANLFGEAITGPGNKLCLDGYCVIIPGLQIFELSSLTGTDTTWTHTAGTGTNVQQLIYTKYKVNTVENLAFGVSANTPGYLHAFTCVAPEAGTAPTNTNKDMGDFQAYNAMLNFINSGLLEQDSKGLKYLQNALGID